MVGGEPKTPLTIRAVFKDLDREDHRDRGNRDTPRMESIAVLSWWSDLSRLFRLFLVGGVIT